MKVIKLLLYLILAISSYFTIWIGHNQPNTLVWDEHFHIASAQKYLNSIYFQEPHPPLGKLLIALGESILKVDTAHTDFLNFDRAPSTPENFKVSGYRFFPALFTCAIPLLLFDLLVLATSSLGLSFLVSLLLAFDLALSTHSRVAHLEAFQIVFLLLSISSFLRLHNCEITQSKKATLWSLFFGLFFGLSVATKITSLVVAPLFLFFPGRLKERFFSATASLAMASLVFLAVFYIHFSLGRNIQPDLDSKGYYGAAKSIQPIIKAGVSPTTFPIFISEWIRYFKKYEKGVPRLNLCKSQENGSYPLVWPLGGGTISYSWKKDGEVTRYVQLITNPVVWVISFFGFLFGLAHLLNRLISEKSNRTDFPFSDVLTALYICYYIAMLLVDRVMYLYHALIPLVLGLILFAVRTNQFQFLFGFRLNRFSRTGIGIVLFTLTIGAYSFFSPLSSYKPITEDQFKIRQWFDLWNLKCANCNSENPIAKPILGDDQKNISKDYWKVEIDGVKSKRIEQQWGEPKTNLDVDGQPLVVGGVKYEIGIGTHAWSKIEFVVPKNVTRFEVLVGVSDQERANMGSVIFEVKSNSKTLFTSRVMRSREVPVKISVPVSGADSLELFAYDAGDGNSYDHACWLSPHFVQ